MIRINGIEKRFNDFSLLIEDISIKGGEIIGLIGNNGAGKTTLLKVVLDLLKPNSGIVKNFEVDIDKSEDWKPNTGAYLDEDFLITYLKPIEYLTLLRSIKKIEDQEFKRFLGTIEPFCGNLLNSTKYIGELSKGNKQKIGISGALLGDLSLVVLDEPFSNLDPSSCIFLSNYFKHIRSKNSISIISSHNIHQLLGFCNRFILLHDGKIVLDETDLNSVEEELDSFFKGC